MEEMNDLDVFSFGLDFHNFEAENVQTEETINLVFVVDVSPSTREYVDDFNSAFNDFVTTMQNSHVHDRLFVSVVEFNEKVNVVSGFQPITGLKPITFVPSGRMTALYDAVGVGLKNALEYRNDLENSGVSVKTLLFVITDGNDNSSKYDAADIIKAKMTELKNSEPTAFTFQPIMFGVGDNGYFEESAKAMGIDTLAKIGTSGKEIRELITIISSSVSKSASGGNPADLSF